MTTALLRVQRHVHRTPCAVCDAAAAATAAASAAATVAATPRPSPPVQQSSSPSSSSTLAASTATTDDEGATTIEWRRHALQRWLRDVAAHTASTSTTTATATATAITTSDDDDEQCWRAYARDPTRATDDVIDGAVNYLDRFCRRVPDDTTTAMTTQTAGDGVRVPRMLHVAARDSNWLCDGNDNKDNIKDNNDYIDETAANTFAVRVRRAFARDADVQKQLRFQRALLAMQRVLQVRARVPFFLACGTALAAHREGYFVAHDDDIDLGIFYDDLVAVGKDEQQQQQQQHNAMSQTTTTSSSSSSTDDNDNDGDDEAAAALAVMRVVNAVARDGAFVVFDVLGRVACGLELRLLHRATNVRVDVNVYYAALASTRRRSSGRDDGGGSADDGDGDAALVRVHGPFVWAASYYEQAHQRRHGMYRYRHAPFRHQLTWRELCAPSSSSLSSSSLLAAAPPQSRDASHGEGVPGVFRVPPQSYLVEYFGDDWRTPHAYTYSEGLRTHYKNIIDE